MKVHRQEWTEDFAGLSVDVYVDSCLTTALVTIHNYCPHPLCENEYCMCHVI